MAKRDKNFLYKRRLKCWTKSKNNLPIQVRGSLLKSLKSQEALLLDYNKEEELGSRWCEVICHGHKPAKKLKHLRKAPEEDTALNQWFGTVTSKGQKLCGPGEGRGFSQKVRTH